MRDNPSFHEMVEMAIKLEEWLVENVAENHELNIPSAMLILRLCEEAMRFKHNNSFFEAQKLK